MRFVALKSEEQLDLQSLHRARDRLVGERTALINQLRAILLESGITLPQGRKKLESILPQMIENSGDLLSDRIRHLLEQMSQDLRDLTKRNTAFDDEFTAFARNDAACQRLESIPGIGSLNATAFVAAIDEAQAFARGRDLAAWLGLVPRQMTTGGKPRLLGISKRGNAYLRRMLIHGARAAMPHLARTQTATGSWLRGLIARAHPNVVVVALAAKMARIIWAVLQKRVAFEYAGAAL
ncbi:transposase (plasmid) [Ensifer sp. WSM1721]